MLATMTAHQLAERLFDVVSQFNRGAPLIISQDERAIGAAQFGCGPARAGRCMEEQCDGKIVVREKRA